MRITIKYEASWRNSFLDGSNNGALPKNGRKFIGSMTNLKQAGNFISRDITLDTVMGILNRLIGDQRKLYQSRQCDNYFFADIEPYITFTVRDDRTKITNSEMVYIRNMTGNTDQNSIGTGAIKSDDPILNSDYSQEFWGLLALDFTELCNFIINDYTVAKTIDPDPLSIVDRLEILNKEKAVADEGKVSEAKAILSAHYPDADYLDGKGNIKPIMFYCSGLYLQLERLKVRYDVSSAKTKTGCISGINNARKPGFTKKNLMGRFSSGEKTIWGNPYLRKVFVKGEGKVALLLTKANGTLDIQLEISDEKARLLERMIEAAGVSSFYIGKKGLAYVESLRL